MSKRIITIGSWLSRADARLVRRALVDLYGAENVAFPALCQSVASALEPDSGITLQLIADTLGAEVGRERVKPEPARPRGQPRISDRRVTVSVTDNQVAELDRLVDDDGARSRAAAVRLLIERHAAERAKDEES